MLLLARAGACRRSIAAAASSASTPDVLFGTCREGDKSDRHRLQQILPLMLGNPRSTLTASIPRGPRTRTI